jgi:hypothetical protein
MASKETAIITTPIKTDDPYSQFAGICTDCGRFIYWSKPHLAGEFGFGITQRFRDIDSVLQQALDQYKQQESRIEQAVDFLEDSHDHYIKDNEVVALRFKNEVVALRFKNEVVALRFKYANKLLSPDTCQKGDKNE